MTDFLPPQNLWLSVQGSSNSLSSTPTLVHTQIRWIDTTQQKDISLAQSKLRVLQYQK